MKKIQEIRDWLLENAVDNEGDLYLIGLDFSDFDGDVYISHMKVKKSLHQNYQEVGEDLYQHYQKVGRDFYNHKLNEDEYWGKKRGYVVRKKIKRNYSRGIRKNGV